ncbi:hypothetical protein AWQ24_15040 (plasmid) [Picosynechococcus sp. PCC 8807]|nr:hypothetical protein AWQ24_15040 [Picosynechococcus sp. PCC 8807]
MKNVVVVHLSKLIIFCLTPNPEPDGLWQLRPEFLSYTRLFKPACLNKVQDTNHILIRLDQLMYRCDLGKLDAFRPRYPSLLLLLPLSPLIKPAIVMGIIEGNIFGYPFPLDDGIGFATAGFSERD